MFTEKLNFDKLKVKSKIDFDVFRERDCTNDDFIDELPNDCLFSELCIEFECIDVRVFNSSFEHTFYRVKNNLIWNKLNEVPIGDYVSVYDQQGELIDELIDIYSR